MTTSIRLLTGALLLAGLLACGSQPVSLTGRILDQAGTPVGKAEVSTDPETDVVMTNNNGYFTLRQKLNESGDTTPIPPGVYKIKVKKFGFDDGTFEVNIEGGPTKVPDISLAPRTPDINDTAPEATEEKPHDADTTSTPVQGN